MLAIISTYKLSWVIETIIRSQRLKSQSLGTLGSSHNDNSNHDNNNNDDDVDDHDDDDDDDGDDDGDDDDDQNDDDDDGLKRVRCMLGSVGALWELSSAVAIPRGYSRG